MRLRCQTRLQHAIRQGDVKAIKHIVEVEKCKVNDEDMDLATELGNLDIIEYFFFDVPDWLINERTKRNECMLMVDFNIAAAYGHLHILRFFEKIYPEIFMGSNWGLYEASENGHFEIVKFYFERGTTFPLSCLFDAVCNENVEMIKYLHENGFSFEYIDRHANNLYTLNVENNEAYLWCLREYELGIDNPEQWEILLFLYTHGQLKKCWMNLGRGSLTLEFLRIARCQTNMQLWKRTVKWMHKVRPYACHWFQDYQEKICAPGGSGRRQDMQSFIMEFT